MEGRSIPHVVIDYMYLNEKFEKGKRKTTFEGEGLPIVVVYDSTNSKGAFAFAVPNKGECQYSVRKTSQCIGKTLGYHKFIFKGDQEPALQTLMDRSGMLCGEQVIREASPVGESQSNGAIEALSDRRRDNTGQSRVILRRNTSVKLTAITQHLFGW